MNSIPIFDSLTHPMPDSNWLSDRYSGKNSIQTLNDSMKNNNIMGALAVGLGAECGGYTEESYAKFILSNSTRLIPVAFVNFSKISKISDVKPYIHNLKSLGYSAIKIHPRISDITYKNSFLPELINVANEIGMGVLICTYFWGKSSGYGDSGLDGLASLLSKEPDQKVILLHGGGVKLLEVSELVRHFPNILLDLSFTLCKYEGSSIDSDIDFLFKKFDKRICIGSDSPEFSQDQLRSRFDFFSKSLSVSQAENIAYKNIIEHLSLYAKN